MILELEKKHIDKIYNFSRKESFINYFILISLEREKEMYDKYWAEIDEYNNIKAILFRRKTGNMQFYACSEYDTLGFTEIFKKEKFNKLLGEESILANFENHYNFKDKILGAFISMLDNNEKLVSENETHEIKKIETSDIDRVTNLYTKVFDSFSSKDILLKRLNEKSGRGYYIEDNKRIVSIAQSAYEDDDTAIIVGVATDTLYQRKGLATICITKLCDELLKEGKKLYLQYDNLEAGILYKNLGFRDVFRMVSYINS